MHRRSFFKTLVAPAVAAIAAKTTDLPRGWGPYFDQDVLRRVWGGAAGGGKSEVLFSKIPIRTVPDMPRNQMMFIGQTWMNNPRQNVIITGIGEE